MPGFLFAPCCCNPPCDQVCVTVHEYCGGDPPSIIYNEACDEWLDFSTLRLTDANGVWPLDIQDWASGSYATQLIAYNSVNIWDVNRDCITLGAGTGYYGYYFTWTPTTVVCTLRIEADVCPVNTSFAVGTVADGSIVGGSLLFVEYASSTAPRCGPIWSANFGFVRPATRYQDNTGVHGGSPPRGVVTLPVAAATLAANIAQTGYIRDAIVVLKDRNGKQVATCTTNGSGRCCLGVPAPDQYWVSASKAGCEQVGCVEHPIEISPCPETCVESISCGSCGGVELAVSGGTVVNQDGTHTRLTWVPNGSYWQSDTLGFETDWAYSDDSEFLICFYTAGVGVPYHYRFKCSGEDMIAEIWTYPITVCQYGGSICGFYTGDFETGIPPPLARVWSSTATATCADNKLVATFDFGVIATICDGAIPPPSPHVTVQLQQTPLNHVVCCSPCPIPRKNLEYSFSGPFSNGSATLVYTANPPQWNATGVRLTCFLGLTFLLPDFESVNFPMDTASYYTCKPFFMQWVSGGVTYTVQE